MRSIHIRSICAAALVGILAFVGAAARPAAGDETCNSPYMGNLIKGQEDYLYVWALGVKGMGDGSDKLVTIDVNPASSRYGKVVNKVSVRGQGEAHHMGFTDDRRFLWAGGLDDSAIFVFDAHGQVRGSRKALRDEIRTKFVPVSAEVFVGLEDFDSADVAIATDWQAAFGLPADLIKGATAISGIFDLEPIRRCYLNDVVQMDEAAAERNSPLHLPLGRPCPVVVAVGERETGAFHDQSHAYAARLEAAGWPCTLMTEPGLDHFAIVMTLGDPKAPLVRVVARQLGLGAA